MSASLIIIVNDPDGKRIDLSSGFYQFGISKVNSPPIIESTYQSSNRFDNLEVGRYYWAVRDTRNFEIKDTGFNDVLPINGSCVTYYVDNLNYIVIPKSFHNKAKVSDVICYETIDADEDYQMFIPDDIRIDYLTQEVTVRTLRPFIGKIEIC